MAKKSKDKPLPTAKEPRDERDELSDAELQKVSGGDGVVGGALTAGKVSVPWAIFKP